MFNHRKLAPIVWLAASAVMLGILVGLVLPRMPDTSITAQSLVHGDRAYHFGFKKSRDGQPASIDQEGFKPLLDKHGAIFSGSPDDKSLYLTFDNGYENGYTAPIMDVLKAKSVPACFFVTGHYVKDQPELLKRMTAEGHLIGNHSWTHPDMSQLSDMRIQDELDRVKREVAQLTGQKEMAYLRPPRGIFSERSLAVSRSLGYTNVFWSVAYKDWETNAQRGAQHAYDSVVPQLHPGAVILLHSVSKDNAEALGRIIDEAKRQGYTFRSLDYLQKAGIGVPG
jgi:peptidoglycan-N-acetylmuramic acid deacetylase